MNTARNTPTDDLYMVVLLRGGDDDEGSHQHWISQQIATFRGTQTADSTWKIDLAADGAIAAGSKIAAKSSNYFVCVIRHRRDRSTQTTRAVFLSENCQDCPAPSLVSKTPPVHAGLQQTLEHYRLELNKRIQECDYAQLLEERKKQRQKLKGAS